MLTVPFTLGLVLILCGFSARLLQKSWTERWVGAMLVFAGCLLSAEALLSRLCPSLEALQPGLYVITLCLICIVIILKYGKLT